MPRPRRVYDPMTGAYDKRRSAEPMPVREVSDHAYAPAQPGWGEASDLSRPGPYRRRLGDGRVPTLNGHRVA